MNTNSLDSKEIKHIEKIVLIAEAIGLQYDKLLKMEINKKTNTEEFEDCLKKINSLKTIEDSMYQESFINKKESLIEDYLSDVIYNNIYYSNVSYLLENDISIRSFQRIMNTLKSNVIHSKYIKNVFEINISANDLGIDDKEEMEEYLEDILKTVKKQIRLVDIMEKDYMFILLSNLEKYINNNKYYTSRSDLLEKKYNIIYIDKRVERSMVENHMEVSHTPFLDAEYEADLMSMDLEEIEDSQLMVSEEGINNCVNYLLDARNSWFYDVSMMPHIINAICILKTSLYFLEDDLIAETYQDVLDTIEKFSNNSHAQKNKVGHSLIKSSFETCLHEKKSKLIKKNNK